MKALTNKVAVVTEASAPRGIGRATALRLAQDGAAVVLTDIEEKVNIDGIDHRTIELLARTASEIEAAGARAIVLDLDVTRKEDNKIALK